MEKENIGFTVSPKKMNSLHSDIIWSTSGTFRKKTPLKENESKLF